MPWHPIQQAHRVDTDLLYCIDPWIGPWAIVRRLTYGDEVWYRATTADQVREQRQLVGYSQDLRALVMRAYRRSIGGQGPERQPDTPSRNDETPPASARNEQTPGA